MTTEPPDNSSLQPVEEKPLTSAGTLLQQERIRRGLSEKLVADQLHITMHYVRAIESDHYEKLPGTVFARGYIKSYALLLELNQDELVHLFNQVVETENAAVQELVRRTEARKKKTRMVPWLVISLIAFIAGFLMLWLYNNYFGGAEAGAAIEDYSDLSALQVAAAASGNPGSDSLSASASTNGSLLISEGLIKRAEALPQESPGQSPIQPERGHDGGGEFSSFADHRLIEMMNIGPDLLHLAFSGECWVEIRDAGSMQTYRDIQKPGDIVRISGTAPFSILLSEAEYVTMALNGSNVAIYDEIRIDNSARLTVGL